LAELKALESKIFRVDFVELIQELSLSNIIWFDEKQLEVFAVLKSYMSSQKKFNRTIDWFIATQCLVLDYTLVTANIKDYEFIPNLKVKFYDQKNNRWQN
jgi:predicted nucleic acid-binding protein